MRESFSGILNSDWYCNFHDKWVDQNVETPDGLVFNIGACILLECEIYFDIINFECWFRKLYVSP